MNTLSFLFLPQGMLPAMEMQMRTSVNKVYAM